MKKLILATILILGFANANDINPKYANMHAKTRTFKNVKEFKRDKVLHNKKVHNKSPNVQRNAKYYGNHDRYTNSRYGYNSGYQNIDRYNPYHVKPQRGYRHPKKSWFYAYRYTKADFVDRYGFYYGYFDRRGYMFEGEFYRYDRDYRYQDRLRGRGLFDRRVYYAPLPRIYRDELYR
jgi:hypothetical protein